MAFAAHPVMDQGDAFSARGQHPFAMGADGLGHLGAELLDGVLPFRRGRAFLQHQLLENKQVLNVMIHKEGGVGKRKRWRKNGGGRPGRRRKNAAGRLAYVPEATGAPGAGGTGGRLSGRCRRYLPPLRGAAAGADGTGAGAGGVTGAEAAGVESRGEEFMV